MLAAVTSHLTLLADPDTKAPPEVSLNSLFDTSPSDNELNVSAFVPWIFAAANVITKLLPKDGAVVAPKEALLIVIVSLATKPEPDLTTSNEANDAVPLTPEANVILTSAPVPDKLPASPDNL